MLAHHTIEEADEERMSVDGNHQSDEEHQQPSKKKPVFGTIPSLLNCWQVAIKLIELLLCILCTGLIIDPLKMANIGSEYLHHISLIFATYIGYILIICVILVGRLFRDRLPFKTNAIFALVGSGMFLATGCVIFSSRDNLSRNHFFHPNIYMYNMLITSAVFALINSIVFAFDTILIIRYQSDL